MYSHLNERDEPGMVDISTKKDSARIAVAEAMVELGPEITKELAQADFQTKKGSIVQTAVIAGTMAAKRTADTIPLCHQIPLSSIKIGVEVVSGRGLKITATVKTQAPTGVEMEAMHAASVAALTVYDMCKSKGHGINITDLRLLEKRGGKSDYNAPETS